MISVILYEYPFNERVRTWLRLERLFNRFAHLQKQDASIEHHFALVTLFEILDVVTRPDLKSEIMHDLLKQKQTLESYLHNPSIAQQELVQILKELQLCFQQLEKANKKSGSSLIENSWLTAIRSRISIPGGTCEFDLPAYHAWLCRTAEKRQADLEKWIYELHPISQSISLLLHLIRSTGLPQKNTASNGFFQQNMPQGRSFQLLRLKLAQEARAVPEISANRLMVTIRMMEQDIQEKQAQKTQSVDFELTLCS